MFTEQLHGAGKTIVHKTELSLSTWAPDSNWRKNKDNRKHGVLKDLGKRLFIFNIF